MNYDFPVQLENIYTSNGFPVPGKKAVIRTDNNRPVSVVSDRYRLIPYQMVTDAAQSFLSNFGKPEVAGFVSPSGDTMVATYTFKEQTVEIQKGDLVGFRVYIENSYNAKKKVRFSVGGLRLVCTNGMVSSNSFIDVEYRHVGKDIDLRFPNPKTVIENFFDHARIWTRLSEVSLNPASVLSLMESCHENGLIPESEVPKTVSQTQRKTAWDIYNHCTYHITHRSKISPINKIRKLERVDKFFANIH